MAATPSVLIVDDESMSRGLLRSILKNFECTTIQEASGGEQAVTVYKDSRPDIVFLDINMPVKNGMEALKEIKALDAEAFVVMVTADSTLENVKAALESGAKGFIAKPYSMGKVEEILIKHQSEKSSQAA